MADDTTFRESLAAAAGPAQVSADGVSVQQRPVADLIAGDKYARANSAFRRRGHGAVFSKLAAHGAVLNTDSDSPSGEGRL